MKYNDSGDADLGEISTLNEKTRFRLIKELIGALASELTLTESRSSTV